MKRQKNVMLKIISVFVLYSLISSAWGCCSDKAPPIQLSLEDASILSKLIIYPKLGLKNRQWSALDHSEKNVRKISVELESDYYDQNENYKKFYKVFCRIGFKDSTQWKCGSFFDAIQIKDISRPIVTEGKISYEEIINLIKFARKSFNLMSYNPIDTYEIIFLKKDKGIYKVELSNGGSFGVARTKQGDFKFRYVAITPPCCRD